MTICEDCGAVFADIVVKCPVCEVPEPDGYDICFNGVRFKAGTFTGWKDFRVRNHDAVRGAVGRELYKVLITRDAETADAIGDDEDEIDSCVEQLARAVFRHYDAYAIAKSLDEDGWTVDFGFVEAIDEFMSRVHDIEIMARQQMVTDNDIVIGFGIGCKVKTPNCQGGPGEVVGFIVDQAKVKVLENGHTRIYCVEQVEAYGTEKS